MNYFEEEMKYRSLRDPWTTKKTYTVDLSTLKNSKLTICKLFLALQISRQRRVIFSKSNLKEQRFTNWKLL